MVYFNDETTRFPCAMSLTERRELWLKRVQRLARWKVDLATLGRQRNAGAPGRARRLERRIERLEAEIEWLEAL